MLEAKDVPFDPIALLRVILNPSDAAGVFESLKAYLRMIDGWSHVCIRRTTLVDKDEWKSFAHAEKKCVQPVQSKLSPP